MIHLTQDAGEAEADLVIEFVDDGMVAVVKAFEVLLEVFRGLDGLDEIHSGIPVVVELLGLRGTQLGLGAGGNRDDFGVEALHFPFVSFVDIDRIFQGKGAGYFFKGLLGDDFFRIQAESLADDVKGVILEIEGLFLHSDEEGDGEFGG